MGIVALGANGRLERLPLVRGAELLRSRIVAVETELRLRGTRLAIIQVARCAVARMNERLQRRRQGTNVKGKQRAKRAYSPDLPG